MLSAVVSSELKDLGRLRATILQPATSCEFQGRIDPYAFSFPNVRSQRASILGSFANSPLRDGSSAPLSESGHHLGRIRQTVLSFGIVRKVSPVDQGLKDSVRRGQGNGGCI
jgi:hypothetical protein